MRASPMLLVLKPAIADAAIALFGYIMIHW